jgi:hypothetical protein
MQLVFLGSFIAGLLLAVRIMFFGAERRRRRAADALPLRWSEPAIANFLIMLGVAGYLSARHGTLSPLAGSAFALVIGAVWSAIASRVAIAIARIQPAHDPEDPRYALQGQVGVVAKAIPAGGEGLVVYDEGAGRLSLRARTLDAGAVEEGQEVCIERVEHDVAYVELWSLVEARL